MIFYLGVKIIASILKVIRRYRALQIVFIGILAYFIIPTTQINALRNEIFK